METDTGTIAPTVETVENGKNEVVGVPIVEAQEEHEQIPMECNNGQQEMSALTAETCADMDTSADASAEELPTIEAVKVEGAPAVIREVLEVPVVEAPIPDTDEIIHAEMVEMHEETVANSSSLIDDSLHLVAEESAETSSLQAELVNEDEMILEETTGEYVLASSVRKPGVKNEPMDVEVKHGKLDLEDSAVAKVLEDNFKGAELQPGEQLVVMTTDEKGNTKEVVLTHTKTTIENGVSVQHVVDESGEVYLIETMDDEEEEELEEPVEENQQVVAQSKAKKSPKLQIPNHLLGRNTANPASDSQHNGKAPMKPRLGVAIPYRNLTSQIVSRQEIANEILERSRRYARENTRQNMFARKMTQNLAKKLQGKKEGGVKNPRGRPPSVRAAAQKASAKLDNSDLLAILEGDEETTVAPARPKPAVVAQAMMADPTPIIPKDQLTPELEREIALKQLAELPPDLTAEEIKAAEEEKKRNAEEKSGGKLPKRDESLKSRFSDSVPLKTYGRKRKTSDDLLQQITANKPPVASNVEKSTHDHSDSSDSPDAPIPSSPAKSTSTPVSDTGYMTKSSRVIKRKVIWDPDEAPPRKSSGQKGVEKVEPKAKDKEKEKPVKEKEAKKVKEEEPKKEVPKREKSLKEKPKEKEVCEESSSEEEAEEKPTTPVKTKRRMNEVSKLLMDEGAVNMLYAIKAEETPQTTRRKKSLQSKADELLNDFNDLQESSQNTQTTRASPKALRKKEATTTTPSAVPPPVKTPKKIMQPPTPSPVVSRQKSKDSNRSSVHSPPPSPGQAGFGGIESRIIRRHSSSSYSSIGEEEDGAVGDERKTRSRGRPRRDVGDAAAKKKSKQDAKVKDDTFAKLVEIKLIKSEVYTKYTCFEVKSLNKLMQIDLAEVADGNKRKVYLTNQLMTELISLLAELEKDKNVNVVLITSQGGAFCDGVNYRTLVVEDGDARKEAATTLAANVRDFLGALAKFSKVLVAGVHGNAYGIGVSMLPLFDTIIAQEDATFMIPNAQLGCIAEGGSMLLLPHLSRNVLVNELLYSSQVLAADEAVKLGLATKVLSKATYARELLANVKNVSDKSAQFMVATKRQLRKKMIPEITSSLADESDSLIEQWTSDECQKCFAEYD